MLVGFETQPEEDETLPLVQVTGPTGARFATTHLDHLLQWNIFVLRRTLVCAPLHPAGERNTCLAHTSNEKNNNLLHPLVLIGPWGV